MNKLVLALTTASLLALTACGGGGDDEPPVQVNQATNQGNNIDPAGNAITPPKEYEPAQVSMWSVSNQPYTQKEAYANGNRDTAEKFDKIAINGKEMSIANIFANTNTLKDHRTLMMEANDYRLAIGTIKEDNTKYGTAYARYGVLNDNLGANETLTLFYQGNPTATMPTSGTDVKYSGTAIAVLPEQGQILSANADFRVNFVGKKLSGTISNWYDKSYNLKNVTINATIDGNTFKGDNNQGKFYGPDAQNMAGSFADKTQKLQGVFGANKQ